MFPLVYLPTFFTLDEGYIYKERFDVTIPFSSEGTNESGHRNGMFGAVSEMGMETQVLSGSLGVSFFYERFLTAPFEGSYNYGLRLGYSFYLN